MNDDDSYDPTRREVLRLLGAAPLATFALQGGIVMAAPSDDRPLAYRGERLEKLKAT